MADLDRLDKKDFCMDPKFQALLKTTDLKILQKMLFEAQENAELIGGKPLLHLDRWEATCGGQDFMKKGMINEWSETNPPPDWLTNPESIRYREYTGDPVREEAFHKLIMAELDQKIIKIVHHNFVKLYNPTFPTPKKGSENWRKVLDLRTLDEYQKDIHFKMEGPEDLIHMARKNDLCDITRPHQCIQSSDRPRRPATLSMHRFQRDIVRISLHVIRR
jgi:hypothetical protein